MLELSGNSCVGAAWAVARVGSCARAVEGFARGSWQNKVAPDHLPELVLGFQAAEMSVVL